MKKSKIALLIYIIILIVLIIKNQFQFDKIYKDNWGVSGIPKPKKIETIEEFVGGGDISYFEIRYYDKEDIEKLKKLKNTKKNNGDLEEIYSNVLMNHYINFLSKEDIANMKKYFNLEKISKKNNYYILLEKETKYRPYVFDLMIIDENLVYAFSCNYCS